MRVALTAKGPGVGTTSIGRILHTFYGFKHINMSDELIRLFAQSRTDCAACADTFASRIISNSAVKNAVRDDLQKFAEQTQWARNYTLQADYEKYDDIVVEKYRTPEQYEYLKARGFLMVKIARVGAPRPSEQHEVYAPYDLKITFSGGVLPTEATEHLYNFLCDIEQA